MEFRSINQFEFIPNLSQLDFPYPKLNVALKAGFCEVEEYSMRISDDYMAQDCIWKKF